MDVFFFTFMILCMGLIRVHEGLKIIMEPNVICWHVKEGQFLQMNCTSEEPVEFTFLQSMKGFAETSYNITYALKNDDDTFTYTFERPKTVRGDSGIYSCTFRNKSDDQGVTSLYVEVILGHPAKSGIVMFNIAVIMFLLVMLTCLLGMSRHEYKKSFRKKTFQSNDVGKSSKPRSIFDEDSCYPFLPASHLNRRDYNFQCGAFGLISLAEAYGISENGKYTRVAVKMAQNFAASILCLKNECEILVQLGKHENLINLLGICFDPQHIENLQLILEYCPKGSLSLYLKTHSLRSSIKYMDLLRWSYEIALGMDYMHQKNVLHRDLALRNVLVGPNNEAKVCDFGSSIDIKKNKNYKEIQDQLWATDQMPIETLKDHIFLIKSEVWSFGVLMWEIFSYGKPPYEGMDHCEVLKFLMKGSRLEKPEAASKEVYALMKCCWKKRPSSRPSFENLVLIIKAFMDSETEPAAKFTTPRELRLCGT